MHALDGGVNELELVLDDEADGDDERPTPVAFMRFVLTESVGFNCTPQRHQHKADVLR